MIDKLKEKVKNQEEEKEGHYAGGQYATEVP